MSRIGRMPITIPAKATNLYFAWEGALDIDYNIALRLDFRAFFFTEGDDAEDIERIYGGMTFFF